MAFSDFSSARAFLDGRLNVEAMRPQAIDRDKVFRTDRMLALMQALGDPQKSYRTVHVAGSKGKGSVCEMTAACLQACGEAVGLYTSPHLIDLSERIRINGDAIAPDQFAAALTRVVSEADKLPSSLGEVTAFELLTATAFQHFADQAVDIAVVEVGLGGRVDATNVLTPDVTAITSIQLEHTHLLGSTREKIAFEKAGIFRPGVPALTVPQPDSVLAVFKEVADKVGAPLAVLGREVDFTYRFEASQDLGPHVRVSVTSPRSNFEHLPVPLKGEHQAFNCGLALAILDVLRGRGVGKLSEGKVAAGLARTPLNGRLELIHRQPRIFIDGAHNAESIQGLVKAIGAQVRYDSMVCVFGCAADKDIPGMLAAIALGADKVIFTRAESSGRAADPRDLYRKFAETSGKMAQVAPTIKDALNMAARAVNRDDLILVTGSFSVAGEAKRLLQEKQRAASEGVIREIKPSGAAARGDGRKR